MKKLRIGIIDIVERGPTRAVYARVMNANLASIMPQVVGVWCREEGHEVVFVCYTGFENLLEELPEKVDLVFISAFTEAAHTAYALSNLFRSRGAVTAIGGPHARCYPEDAQRYFDYVFGFTDKQTLSAILQDCSQHRPTGLYLSASQQPKTLPGVRERWQFIEPTLRKAPFIKFVPMLGSLGCPYTCAFCIDASVPYQLMDFGLLQEDLRFLLTKFKRPIVGWHDPNFGIRFDDYFDMIEEAVPPNSIDFIGESSLSILTEPHLKRLKHNGFKAILPGIESWFQLDGKSNTGKVQGMEKVRQVSEQLNMILRYIPYIQVNFVLGLDADEGDEPFELTKRFLDMTPGVFPGYSLLTTFGQAAPQNLEYQRDNRVLPFPFHFLNNNQSMNVRPRNYSWKAFYDRVISLTEYSFSGRMIYKRFRGSEGAIPRALNLVRAMSTEGFGRIRYHTEIRRRLDDDPEFIRYFEQESDKLPQFYVDIVKKDLGALWDWLPEGGLYHDPHAYLKAQQKNGVQPVINFSSSI
ncbi:MAG: radical SAM protein [Chlorobiales bacterium]|nr:radical SAM protein [Chlorobiales bacterium]